MIHLYCLVVQAGLYSDVVECSTIDRRIPGSILGWGMKIYIISPTFIGIEEITVFFCFYWSQLGY